MELGKLPNEPNFEPAAPAPEVPPLISGFYPIIDTAACARACVKPEALAEAIARAGIPIAQFRHKGPFTREVFEQAEAIGRILRAGNVRYIMNDRADVALMLKADGVHLGQEDLPPAKVRGTFSSAGAAVVGSGLIIGYSTHNREQLLAGDREPVDYLAIGPMFPTGSKENPDPVVGVAELARLRSLTAKPLVAIGGITRTNAGTVLAAGADAVAVISDLLGEDLDARLEDWLNLTRRAKRART
jgi:thiamine-phosphate pyrophosphorylase